MTTKIIIGIIGVVVGLILLVHPTFCREHPLKWVRMALAAAGASAIAWGTLLLLIAAGASLLTHNTYFLIDHFETFFGGLTLGILITLVIAGEVSI